MYITFLILIQFKLLKYITKLMQSTKIIDNKIKKYFKFLKNTKSLEKTLVNRIEVNNNYFLIPLSKVYIENNELIEILTFYRNKYKKIYPTQFEATNSSTKKWLKKLFSNNKRIMFLLINKENSICGIIGLLKYNSLENNLEVDNVVKFDNCKEKNIFSKVLQKLIKFSKEILFVENFQLKVMNNNFRAIKFYKKNGFKSICKIPLIEKKLKNKTVFIENSSKKISDYVINNFFYLMKHYEFQIKKKKNLILTGGPSISHYEISNVDDAIRNGWNNKHSFFIKKLEHDFSSYLNSKYSIATSSCTGAIHIALLALGVKKGDEVIVPDFSWVATARAVQLAGASPIFCDVEKDTWNICPKSLQKLITSKTKVVIPVHMYGEPANMFEIKKICNFHRIKIIEDAAPAIGASIKNRLCGTFGDFAAFSFQGAKLLVAGEGGILTTRNKSLYQKARKISEFGRSLKRTFWIEEPGLKYKMSNIQASIAYAQLCRVDEFIIKKRKIFDAYFERLKELDNFISMHKESKRSYSTYWMSSALLNIKINREKFLNKLLEKNIDTRPTFPKISNYPIWGKKMKNNNINSSIIGSSGFNLPSGLKLSLSEIDYICDTIKSILK